MPGLPGLPDRVPPMRPYALPRMNWGLSGTRPAGAGRKLPLTPQGRKIDRADDRNSRCQGHDAGVLERISRIPTRHTICLAAAWRAVYGMPAPGSRLPEPPAAGGTQHSALTGLKPAAIPRWQHRPHALWRVGDHDLRLWAWHGRHGNVQGRVELCCLVGSCQYGGCQGARALQGIGMPGAGSGGGVGCCEPANRFMCG
jgi:hypothetical protein